MDEKTHRQVVLLRKVIGSILSSPSILPSNLDKLMTQVIKISENLYSNHEEHIGMLLLEFLPIIDQIKSENYCLTAEITRKINACLKVLSEDPTPQVELHAEPTDPVDNLVDLNFEKAKSIDKEFVLQYLDELQDNTLQFENEITFGNDVNAMFRYIHTIKGNSQLMGFREISEVSHRLETILDKVRRNELAISDELQDLFSGVINFLLMASNNIRYQIGNSSKIEDFNMVDLGRLFDRSGAAEPAA